MAKVNKFEVHCTVCGWVSKWARADLVVCPVNPEHPLTEGSKQTQCDQVWLNEEVVSPTADDDIASGYGEGSKWVDTVLKKTYVCVDATEGAAVWSETTPATGDVVFLEAGCDPEESGTTSTEWQDKYELAVDPDASNIFVEWNCELKSSSDNTISFARLVERDGEVDTELSNASSSTNEYTLVNGCTMRPVDGEKTYVVQYKSSTVVKTAYIRRAGIRIDKLV